MKADIKRSVARVHAALASDGLTKCDEIFALAHNKQVQVKHEITLTKRGHAAEQLNDEGTAPFGVAMSTS